MSRHNLGTRSFGSFFNATVLVALLPVIASMIKNRNLLGTCGKTLLHNFRNQLRICITGQFGYFIPTDIRFNHYLLSRFYKLFHATHFCNSTPEHRFRFSTHHSYQIHLTAASICQLLRQYVHCFRTLHGHHRTRHRQSL